MKSWLAEILLDQPHGHKSRAEAGYPALGELSQKTCKSYRIRNLGQELCNLSSTCLDDYSSRSTQEMFVLI